MPNYQKGKIYKIICDETNLTYYGSTVQPLSKRFHQHKEKYNNCNTKLMKNMKIFLVENYPCNSIEELLMRERYYIENNECCNRMTPLRTDKEYYADNRQELLKKKKQYHIEHRDERNKYCKEWYEKNKVLKGRPPLKTEEEKRKYRNEWYSKQVERYKEKFTCECGSTYRKLAKSRHEKSKKHINFINSK